MPPNNFIFCFPLCLLHLILPSIEVFSNKSVLHIRWPKYWRFSFSIGPSNEYSGHISFIVDWLHLLDIRGTLKSRVQHHSSKASILWCSAFFIVQLSHPYMTIGKTMSLTRQTFVGKYCLYLANWQSIESNFAPVGSLSGDWGYASLAYCWVSHRLLFSLQ